MDQLQTNADFNGNLQPLYPFLHFPRILLGAHLYSTSTTPVRPEEIYNQTYVAAAMPFWLSFLWLSYSLRPIGTSPLICERQVSPTFTLKSESPNLVFDGLYVTSYHIAPGIYL